MPALKINGRLVQVDGPADMPLLWALRDILGMTGTKFGCGAALCGACTVQVDGAAARSCIVPLSSVVGKEITTIEGVGKTPVGAAVQKAWLAGDVPQCGYCQSGQIMSACALLAANPKPTDADIDQAMARKNFRCRTYTSLPMLIAEELEVDVDKVAIEHSPPDDQVYANPLIGLQMTGGSTSIRSMFVPLRRAGATARVMLESAAAQQWNVDPSMCRGRNGAVVHAPSGRKLGYGRLVDVAAKLPVPEKVTLKAPADFKLVGKPHRRLDIADKVNGRAKFGIDTRLPGMKYAVLAISPAFGGKLAAVDEAKAMAVPGVSQVIRLPDAVAVVASHTWAAKQGLAAAAPQWDPGPNGQLSTSDVVAQLSEASAKQGVVARHDGDASKVIASAARKVEATYEQPFLAHAAMEPMNCTVHLTKESCDVWVGTQIPGVTQAVLMKVTGLPRERVRIHNHLLGGGFGRRLEFDGTVRAAKC